MTKLEIAKKAIPLVVGFGTSKIVSTIIKNNVQSDNLVDTICIAAGSCVLGSMAWDASKKYTETQIDEFAAWWKENVTEKTAQ